jgi:hypothetical protein
MAMCGVYRLTNMKDYNTKVLEELEGKYHFKFNSCNHGRVADKILEDISEALTQALLQGLKLAKEVVPEERELPFVGHTPFPGEAVEYHLRRHGHLPDIGCCKYDQYSKEEAENFNQARSQTLSVIDLEIKKLEE